MLRMCLFFFVLSSFLVLEASNLVLKQAGRKYSKPRSWQNSRFVVNYAYPRDNGSKMFTKNDIGTIFVVNEDSEKHYVIFNVSKTNDILMLVGFKHGDIKERDQYQIYHFRLGKIFTWFYGNGGHSCFLKQVKVMR